MTRLNMRLYLAVMQLFSRLKDCKFLMQIYKTKLQTPKSNRRFLLWISKWSCFGSFIIHVVTEFKCLMCIHHTFSCGKFPKHLRSSQMFVEVCIFQSSVCFVVCDVLLFVFLSIKFRLSSVKNVKSQKILNSEENSKGKVPNQMAKSKPQKHQPMDNICHIVNETEVDVLPRCRSLMGSSKELLSGVWNVRRERYLIKRTIFDEPRLDIYTSHKIIRLHLLHKGFATGWRI